MATARRQVSIFINGREVENTIKSITAEKRKLVRELNRMVVGSEEYNKTVKQVQQLDGTLAKHRQNIRGIESSWDSVTKGARQFFTLSNLAGVAAMAGITVGAQEAVQAVTRIVEETKTLRREISQTTGAVGKDLDTLTVGVKALGETFNTDQREVLLATNTLVKEFGESYSTALDEIGRGFLEGANLSGEFLQNIREYSTQFRAAGFSAKEFVDIAIFAQQQGIFSDKGLDAIKEFGLRITEQTAAAGDALDAAFGKEFTDRIFKGINDGSISTAKALQLVSKEMQNIEVPANRLQTVIADVFGGPGEDAGLRFIQLLGEVQTETDNATTTTNTYAEAQRELLEANQELAFSENELTKQLEDTSDALTVFWTNLKTGAINVLVDVLQYFERFSATLAGVRAALREGFSDFNLGDVLTLGNPLKIIDELQTKGKDIGKAYREAFLEGLEQIETQKEVAKTFRLQEEEAEAEIKRIEDQQKRVAAAREKTRKEAEAAAARELQQLQSRAEKLRTAVEKLAQEDRTALLDETEKRLELIRQRYQKEIDESIALEQSKNQQVAEAATAQRIELERLQSEALKTEREKIFQEELARIAEQQDEITALEIEKRFEQAEARREADQEIAAYLREAVLSEQEQALLDLEEQYNNLISLAQQNAIDTLDIEIAYRKKKQELTTKFDKEEINELAKSQAERAQILQDSFRAISDVIGGVLSVIGTEAGKYTGLQKALTLAQIAIDTASAIASLVRNSEANPLNIPTAGIAGAIQFATGLARILTNIGKARQLLSEATVPQRKRGGYATVRGEDDGQTYRAQLIGQPATGLLDYPHPVLTSSGILANEAGREYYVSHSDLRNPKVLRHVEAIENIRTYRQRQTGGFAGVAQPPATPTENQAVAQNDNSQSDALLIQLLSELLRRGVHVQLDDNTLIAMQKRMGELVKASGGRVLQ